MQFGVYSDFAGEINPLDTKNFMPKRESFGSETNKNRGMDLVRTVTRTGCNTSYTKITKTNCCNNSGRMKVFLFHLVVFLL